MQTGAHSKVRIKSSFASLCLGLGLFASSTLETTADPAFDTVIELCTKYPKGSIGSTQLENTLKDTGWVITEYTTREEAVRQIHAIYAALSYYTASADSFNVLVEYLNEHDTTEMGVLRLAKDNTRFLMIVFLGGYPVCLLAGSDQVITALDNISLTKREHFPAHLRLKELPTETSRTLYEAVIDDTYVAHAAVVDKTILLEKIQSFKGSKYDFNDFLDFYNAIHEVNIFIGPAYLTNKVTP